MASDVLLYMCLMLYKKWICVNFLDFIWTLSDVGKYSKILRIDMFLAKNLHEMETENGFVKLSILKIDSINNYSFSAGTLAVCFAFMPYLLETLHAFLLWCLGAVTFCFDQMPWWHFV